MAVLTLFPADQKTALVADIRANQLMLAAQDALPGVTLSDDYIYAKLISAEKEISRALKVYLVPTYLVPDDAPQSELDDLDSRSPAISWDQESSYDYVPELFQGNPYGYFRTKSIYINSVASMRFVYPGGNVPYFDVPLDWIKLDRRAGDIRLVPSSSAFLAPLNSWIMSVLAGGREIPMMIQIRYTAGLKNCATEWPDIIDVIKRKAVYKILMESYVPASGSISADGLSQSMSIDMSKYGDAINETLFGPKGSNGGLWVALHGITSMVV